MFQPIAYPPHIPIDVCLYVFDLCACCTDRNYPSIDIKRNWIWITEFFILILM